MGCPVCGLAGLELAAGPGTFPPFQLTLARFQARAARAAPLPSCLGGRYQLRQLTPDHLPPGGGGDGLGQDPRCEDQGVPLGAAQHDVAEDAERRFRTMSGTEASGRRVEGHRGGDRGAWPAGEDYKVNTVATSRITDEERKGIEPGTARPRAGSVRQRLSGCNVFPHSYRTSEPPNCRTPLDSAQHDVMEDASRRVRTKSGRHPAGAAGHGEGECRKVNKVAVSRRPKEPNVRSWPLPASAPALSDHAD